MFIYLLLGEFSNLVPISKWKKQKCKKSLTVTIYMHLTHFHASYSPILLLLWCIVLNNIISIFFLDYLFFYYIFVYRKYFSSTSILIIFQIYTYYAFSYFIESSNGPKKQKHNLRRNKCLNFEIYILLDNIHIFIYIYNIDR